MQSGKIDVWNKIKQRAAAMDVEAAHEARRAKELAKKRHREMMEAIEIGFSVVFILIVLVGITWGGYELFKYCSLIGCGR